MPSTYTPLDFVQLPRMGASGALGLGRQMLSAAQAFKALPKNVAKARDALSVAHEALRSAMVDQFGHGTTTPAEGEPPIQVLDRIIDNCWGGLDDRLVGLIRLPEGTPGKAEAEALRRRLFPTGLDFLKLNNRLEWTESQTRLDLIERDNLEPAIGELAGKQFLVAIRKAHESYGRALGMSVPLKGAVVTPQVRGAFDAFATALRSYVVKVMASVEDDLPATQATADALLAPLAVADWTFTPTKPSKGEAVPAEPVGGAPEKGSADE